MQCLISKLCLHLIGEVQMWATYLNVLLRWNIKSTEDGFELCLKLS